MTTLNDPNKLLLEGIHMRMKERKQYKADLRLAVEAVSLAHTETAYWKNRCADAEDKLINIKLFGES